MNVLFLTWNFPPTRGGMENVAGRLHDGLSAKGLGVMTITGYADEATDPKVRRASRPGFVRFLFYALASSCRYSRSNRPQVVLCGSVVTAPIAWFLRMRYGIPYAVLIHGSDVLHAGWWYQGLVRLLLRRANAVFANSGQTKTFATERGIPANRIEVIHPGVDTEPFDSGTAPETFAPMDTWANRPVLMTVGRLIMRKGVLFFVEEVMPTLIRDVPNLLYVVVGEDARDSLVHKERMRTRIERAIEEHGMTEHVALLGGVSNDALRALYERADLFVLPCLDLPGDIEGFGIVFSEAALAGTASVATRVGGIPEAVEDGVTGLLAPPGDAAELTGAITRLLEDDPMRAQMAQAGAERARARFAWPVIIERYATALRRIGNSSSKTG